MKTNWQTKKLGEVCEVVNGGTPKTNVQRYWDGSILWITPKDMGKLDSFFVADTERKITEAGLKNSSAKVIPADSIILSTRAPIGHLAINKKEITTNQGCKGLIPKNDLNVYFLFYFLKMSVDLLNSLGSGTTFKELSGTKLKEVEIPLPPLPEQQRIVAILDEAFAAIATAKENAEKNLQNARELFESYLQSVFANPGDGWEEKKLGEVCIFKGGGTPSTKVEKYWKGEIPWVSPKDMKSKFISDSQDHVSNEAVENSATSLISKGSILIVVRSGILARVVPIAITERELTINQDLKAICPNKNIDSDYLYYFFQGNMLLLLSMVSRGATVHRLTTDHLRGLSIGFPPLPEQRSIVAKLDALSAETKKLESIYRQKLADLDELKKSVLQKAFEGEL